TRTRANATTTATIAPRLRLGAGVSGGASAAGSPGAGGNPPNGIPGDGGIGSSGGVWSLIGSSNYRRGWLQPRPEVRKDPEGSVDGRDRGAPHRARFESLGQRGRADPRAGRYAHRAIGLQDERLREVLGEVARR